MKDIIDAVRKLIGDDETAQGLSIAVQSLSIMGSFLNCESLEPEVLAAQLYKDKRGMIPMEVIAQSVEQLLPRLIDEGMLHPENGLSDEVRPQVENYVAMMEGSHKNSTRRPEDLAGMLKGVKSPDDFIQMLEQMADDNDGEVMFLKISPDMMNTDVQFSVVVNGRDSGKDNHKLGNVVHWMVENVLDNLDPTDVRPFLDKLNKFEDHEEVIFDGQDRDDDNVVITITKGLQAAPSGEQIH